MGDLAEMGRVTERALVDGSCVCWKPSLQPGSVQRWRYVPGGSTLVPLFPILAFLFLSIYLSIIYIRREVLVAHCKESAYNLGNTGLIPGLRKILWRRAWQPSPVFLPGKSHGFSPAQGAWRATVHGGHKELDTTEWLNNRTSLGDLLP